MIGVWRNVERRIVTRADSKFAAGRSFEEVCKTSGARRSFGEADKSSVVRQSFEEADKMSAARQSFEEADKMSAARWSFAKAGMSSVMRHYWLMELNAWSRIHYLVSAVEVGNTVGVRQPVVWERNIEVDKVGVVVVDS
jgi:hypothetical protein